MTRVVTVKNIKIGAGNPIPVQSMLSTPTMDEERSFAQIERLTKAGCDIIRLAVSSVKEVEFSRRYIEKSSVPLVADIQYDYRLAVKAAEVGFAKIRFNPGNIGSSENVKTLVDACKHYSVPIRIGVNAGSLEKDILEKYGATAEGLAESALRHALILEKYGFNDIVLSAKSSDTAVTVGAYRILSQKCDYPLHIGVTESGVGDYGKIKSAVGLGALLIDGIGDTIRVSLSGDPVEEVNVANEILRAAGKGGNFCEIVSCPTCSRTTIDVEGIARHLTKKAVGIRKKLKVAVMGCAVNGPGEARDADFGIAGGGGKAVIFVKGEHIKTVSVDAALKEAEKFLEDNKDAR